MPRDGRRGAAPRAGRCVGRRWSGAQPLGVRRAFEETPRERFVPRFYRSESGHEVLVDGTDPQQRDEWLRGVYADDALTVQLKQGTTPVSPGLVADDRTLRLMAQLHLARLRLRGFLRPLDGTELSGRSTDGSWFTACLDPDGDGAVSGEAGRPTVTLGHSGGERQIVNVAACLAPAPTASTRPTSAIRGWPHEDPTESYRAVPMCASHSPRARACTLLILRVRIGGHHRVRLLHDAAMLTVAATPGDPRDR